MEFNRLKPTAQQAIALAKKHYNLTITSIKPLDGEVDFNFKITTQTQQTYTLKISRPNPNTDELNLQTAILNHLSTQNIPLNLPNLLPNTQNQSITQYTDDQNQTRYLRILKWVPGTPLAYINPWSPEFLYSWGQTCGLLSKALQGFDHPAAHRFYKWNPSTVLHTRKFLPYFQTAQQKEIAQYFWNLFESQALPKLPSLRMSINHNDAHELNLLATQSPHSSQVNGVIDFGDALYTHTLNELAIACAYACMNQPEPIRAAQSLIKGYHSVFPLTETELQLLYYLITARLMLTVSNAAWNKHQEPDNEYLLISEKPAWELLTKLRNIHPQLAHFQFRQACNLEPNPKHHAFVQWLTQNQHTLYPLIDYTNHTITPIDLSVGSHQLGNNSQFLTASAFQQTINRILLNQNATLGLGGYAETRPIYTTDSYQTIGNQGLQWRTVHLGIDLWAKAGTPIHSPLAGTVHSFQNNDHERDYGPTIILKHQPTESLTFYTLYGHLSPESL